MAQLGKRRGLDLANSFVANPERPTDLPEGPRASVAEAKAEPYHALLARGERLEDRQKLSPQESITGRVERGKRNGIRDGVCQRGVAILPDGHVKR